MTPRPLTLHVADDVLTDLDRRLRSSRLLPDSRRAPRSGMSAGYLHELVASWQVFDWRAREEWLSAYPQFLVEIDDATIHYAHLRSLANPEFFPYFSD